MLLCLNIIDKQQYQCLCHDRVVIGNNCHVKTMCGDIVNLLENCLSDETDIVGGLTHDA